MKDICFLIAILISFLLVVAIVAFEVFEKVKIAETLMFANILVLAAMIMIIGVIEIIRYFK